MRLVGGVNWFSYDQIKDEVGMYSIEIRQKLALARTLERDPEILVLDEPTAKVDPTR